MRFGDDQGTATVEMDSTEKKRREYAPHSKARQVRRLARIVAKLLRAGTPSTKQSRIAE
jgi:hypothetical protein